jgi:hypothetical protein
MERAKIDRLPKDVRAQLDAKIITQSFSGYVGLAKWLTEQGYEIKKSAVHAHGQKLQYWLDSIKRTTETARAIVADSPDEANVVGDALLRMITDRLFVLVHDLDLDNETIGPEKMAKLAKSIAELCRAQVNQKKWEQELREEMSGRLDKNVEEARAKGIDPQVLERAKELVRGVLDV